MVIVVGVNDIDDWDTCDSVNADNFITNTKPLHPYLDIADTYAPTSTLGT